MDNIIDRVENKRIDQTRKLFMFCGIGLLVISAIKILTANHIQITGKGWWFDTSFFIIGGIASLTNYIKLSNRMSQFIEWKADTITYKLKNNITPLTIEKAQIKTISTSLNFIEIVDNNEQINKLDISDFSDYKTRTKIKDNFERQKNCAHTD